MPATNAWFFSRFFSSPGCRRIRSRQTSSVSAGSSASGPSSSSVRPGTLRVDARPGGGRPCPSGSGRGSGSRPRRRRPASSPRRAVQRAASAAVPRVPRSRGRPPSSTAASSPGAASWNRPVSIGLKTTRSRSSSRSRNLPRRRRSTSRCPTRASSSAGVPRTASGPGASVEVTARPGGRRGTPRRRSPGRAVRARPGDCSREKRCARLSRLWKAAQLKTRPATFATKGADRGPITTDHLSIVSDTGLGAAQAVGVFRGLDV